MHYDLVLRGGTFVTPQGRYVADIGCRNGRISTIGDLRTATADQEVDCRNLMVLPGLIDPHVHLRTQETLRSRISVMEHGERFWEESLPCLTCLIQRNR